MDISNDLDFCYFLGHSHLDAAWLWTIKHAIDVFNESCVGVLDLMDKYPDFHYCQSSAQYYQWLEEEAPETFQRIQQKVREGSWEIVGGTWIEPDCQLPSGESLVRQFLYGKKYFKEKFGYNVEIAWIPDSFGFTGSLPQIMNKVGIKYFLTQKMRWNDTTQFPYYFFRWKSPDGSWVLAHQTVGHYRGTANEQEIMDCLKLLKSRQNMNHLLYFIGEGDHGGGVSEEMIKRSLEFTQGKKSIEGRFVTAEQYFTSIEALIEKQSLPEVLGELYLEFHRGVYTTQASIKQYNRESECALDTAEKFSVISTEYGSSYPRGSLDSIWKMLLLNQFHDILPGSSIFEVYTDSTYQFRDILEQTNRIITNSLQSITSRIDTTGQGLSVIIFNPLSWERTSPIEMDLEDISKPVQVYDNKGRIISHQMIDADGKILFIANDVPPCGYKEYKIIERKTGNDPKPSISVEELQKKVVIENQFFKLNINRVTGLVDEIYDKVNQKEVLSKPGNLIRIYEDYPVPGRVSRGYPLDASMFDAWEIFIYDQKNGVKFEELNEPISVKLHENGPVRARVQIRFKYQQKRRPDSYFTHDIMVYDQLPLIFFRLVVDWHTKHRLAKVLFPLTINSEFTTYETPYGYTQRRNPRSQKASPAERAKYEVPGHKWIDHSSWNEDYGVSLLNNSKYGFDVPNNTLRMTLLRSAKYPVELRARYGLSVEDVRSGYTDQGSHEISYALYPHQGHNQITSITKRAYEFNYPLRPITEAPHKGVLPKSHSFISLHPDNVILTVMKEAEDTNDVILRLYETSGKDAKAKIRVYKPFNCGFETNLLEQGDQKLRMKDDTIEVSFSKNEIKTLRLIK